MRFKFLVHLLEFLGGRGRKEEMEKGPGVKQIDGSVVSWKPEQIALSTAALDSLPKNS